MKRHLLALFAILTMACGGTAGDTPEPTCEDSDYRESHYKECVGAEEYAEHKGEVFDLVHDLRDAEADPAGMEDTQGCESMPIHVCSEGDGERCEWAAHRNGSGAKYEALCVCMSDYKYDQVKGSCSGV